MDPVAKTIKTYDQMADEFKRRYLQTGGANVMKRYLDIFIPLLNGKHVLDIGSGAGFDAKYLSDAGLKVDSIDLSTSLLEVARQIAPEVTFHKMDMRHLKFNQKFDGIWSSASFVHIPKSDSLATLQRFCEILIDDGIFYLAVKEGEGEHMVVNSGKENLDGAERFFAYYKRSEVRKLLEEAGFIVFDLITNVTRGNVWLNFYCRKASQPGENLQ